MKKETVVKSQIEKTGPSRVSSRVPREKIRVPAILKENTANYTIVGKVNKYIFRKKNELPVF